MYREYGLNMNKWSLQMNIAPIFLLNSPSFTSILVKASLPPGFTWREASLPFNQWCLQL